MRTLIDKHYHFFSYFVWTFLCLFFIDLLFYGFAFKTQDMLIFVRLFLFDYAVALLAALLLEWIPKKIGSCLLIAGLLFFAVYAIVQLGFQHFMGNYMSFQAAQDGLGRVARNIPEFILALRPLTLVLLLPWIATAIAISQKKMRIKKSHPCFRFSAVILGLTVLIHLAGLLTLSLQQQAALKKAQQLYRSPYPQELALSELGVNRFAWRDLLASGKEEPVLVQEVIRTETEIPQSLPLEEHHRSIEDSLWKEQSEAETDPSIQEIDAYLMNRPISDLNELTGYFAGKNLIYIMVEAFDFMAVDPALTPTLYQMKEKGWDFTHYYTPKYSCTTAESEMIALTSLVPASNVCTPNVYRNNLFSQSLFFLFRRAGYTATSYHNWNDQFYERKTYHLNMGSQAFYSIDDMDFPIIQGWQSDVELIKETLERCADESPFFAFVITSSTHFPYDQSSTLGDRYLSAVNAVYPQAPLTIQRYLSKAIELDKAMETLLEGLQQRNLLEDTVIAVFADHHPLKTSLQEIASQNQPIDRMAGLNMDRTPFFIYAKGIPSKKIEKLGSTYDLLPTIANLFDLNFDPRFYVGVDLFSDLPSLVLFNNGDWISEEGVYYARKKSFEAFDPSQSVDEAWLQNQNNRVSNLFSISLKIYQTDYFRKRDFEVRMRE